MIDFSIVDCRNERCSSYVGLEVTLQPERGFF